MGERRKKVFFFAFLRVSEHFESIETHFFFSKILLNFALRAKRVMVKRGKFFFAFLRVSEHFESIETHFFFFSKIFVSAKRETRVSKASEMRARSAKPEGAKRPSSPAGLAGRSAERACKLVKRKEKCK